MALPVTITGINLTVAPAGPFRSSAGNFYFFGRDGTTATTLQAFKATDPTTSWASVATKTGFTTAILNLASYRVADVIHLLVQDGTASTSQATKYVSFNMANDTFLTTTETVSAASAVAGATVVPGYGASLVVRSNGEVVCFYNGISTKVSSTLYSRVYYRRRTGVNTYGTETQVDAAAAANNATPFAVLGSSDRVHFAWTIATTSNTGYRTLSAANALNTAGSSATIALIGDATSYDRGGTTKVVFTSNTTNQGTLRFDSSDNPTPTLVSQAITAASAPHRVGSDGTDVTVVYRNSTDTDLYSIKSTDDGATFGAPVSFFVGTVVAGDANLSRHSGEGSAIFIRGSSILIPYLVNDNGTLKYNENLLRTIVTLNAANNFTQTLSPDVIIGTPAFTRTVNLIANGIAVASPYIETIKFPTLLLASTLSYRFNIADQVSSYVEEVFTANNLALSISVSTPVFAQIGGGPSTDVLSASSLAVARPNFGVATLVIAAAALNGAWDKTYVNDGSATYSNGDRTATMDSTGYPSSTNSHVSGSNDLVYAEIKIDYSGAPSYPTICSISRFNTSQGLQLWYDGRLTASGYNVTHAHLVYGTGDVLGFAYNAATNRGWVRVNNGVWNAGGTADPATGVGGLSLGAFTAPVVITGEGDYGTALTLNTGTVPFVNSPPSNFLPWYNGSFNPLNANDLAISRVATVLSISASTGETNFGSANVPFVAQSFTATGSSISFISVSIHKNASPSDQVFLSLRNVDAGDLPIGSDLVTSNLQTVSSSSFASYVFTFPTHVLVPGTKYAIVFQRTGAFDETNCYNVATSFNNPYPGGMFSSCSYKFVWSSISVYDVALRIGYPLEIGTPVLTEIIAAPSVALVAYPITAGGNALQVSDPAFFKGGATVVADVDDYADKLIESNATNTHFTGINISFNVGDVISVSADVKPAGRNWISFSPGTASAYFNISTGTIGTVTNAVSGSVSIVALDNGYYRCSLKFIATSISTSYYMGLSNADTVNNYTGDGVSGILVRGYRIEREPKLYSPANYALICNPITTLSPYIGQSRGQVVIVAQSPTSITFGHSGRENDGQTFIPASTFTLSTVEINLRRRNSPVDSLIATIQNVTSGTEIPVGSNLTQSDAILGSNLSTGLVRRTLVFSPPITLIGGNKYAVLFNRTGALDSTNEYITEGGLSDYTSGTSIYFDGASWLTVSNDHSLQLNSSSDVTLSFGPPPIALIANSIATQSPSIAIIPGSSADIVITSTGSPFLFGGLFTGAGGEGQAFVSIGPSVTKVSARLVKYGAPTDGLRCTISTSDASQLPVTSLGQTTISNTSVPQNTVGTVDFTFTTPVTVSNGQLYHVAIDRTGEKDDSNIYAAVLTDGRPYTSGLYSSKNSNTGVWSTDPATNLILTISQGGPSVNSAVLTINAGLTTLVANPLTSCGPSVQLTASSVTTFNCNIIPDADGYSDKLQEDTTAAVFHNTNCTFSGLKVGDIVNMWADLKPAGRTSAWVQISGAYVSFNLATGSVNFVHASIIPGSASIVALDSGYYRCTLKRVTSSTSRVATIGVESSPNGPPYDGDGVSGVYVRGFGLEVQPLLSPNYVFTATDLATQSVFNGAPVLNQKNVLTSKSLTVATEVVGSGAVSGNPFGTISTPQQAQSFIATGTTLKTVTAEFQYSGTPADQLQIQLYAADAGELPTGPVLAGSNYITLTTTAFASYVFTLGNYTLIPGNKYAIVFSRTGALSGSNQYRLGYFGGNVYPNGSASYYNGSVWGIFNNTDFACTLNYDSVSLPSPLLSQSNILSPNSISTQAAFEETPSLIQNQTFTANSISPQTTFKGIPALSQVHVLSSNPFAVASPNFGVVNLGIAGTLSCNPLITQGALLGSPLLGQAYTFNSNALATQSTFKGIPALTQSHTLIPSNIAVAQPFLPSLPMIVARTLSATSLQSQASYLGTPSLSVNYSFISNALATSSAFIGTPSSIVSRNLVSSPLTTQAAFISSPLAPNAIVITGTRQQSFFGDGFTISVGQTFTATGSNIYNVSLYVAHAGGPPDGAVVKIWTVSGDTPQTLIATSNEVLPTGIPSTSSSFVKFTFNTPVPITNGSKYAALLERTGAQSNSYFYIFGYADADVYSGGMFISRDSGGVYSYYPTFDGFLIVNQELASPPLLSVNYSLTANAVAVARPSLPAPQVGIAGIMSALNLSTQSVFKGTPQLNVNYTLAPASVTTKSPAIGTSGGVSVIPSGAIVNIDFIGKTAFVQGTGSVGIETLIGYDPVLDALWGPNGTWYDSTALGPYGYDYQMGTTENGVYPPAFIGALKTATLGGKSIVVTMQQKPGDFTNGNADWRIYIITADRAKQIWFQTGDGYVESGSYNGSIVLADVWQYDDAGSKLNAFGFTIAKSDHWDLASNNLKANTSPLTDSDTPPANPLSGIGFDAYGPIASITVYDTLSLAQLKANTAPVLQGAGAPTGPSLNVNQSLVCTPLVTQRPSIGTPLSSVNYTLTSTAIAVARPTLSIVPIGISGVMAAAPITTSSTALGTPLLSVNYTFTSNTIATGAAFKGIPSLTQNQVLISNAISTQATFKGIPALTQVQIITSNALAVARPSIATPSLGIAGTISAAPIQSQKPTFGAPLLSVVYTLNSSPIATQAVFKGTPVLGKTSNFIANSIATQSVFKGTPALTLNVVVGLDSSDYISYDPYITSTPIFSLELGTVLTASALVTRPIFEGIPPLSVKYTITSSPLVTQSPFRGTPLLIGGAGTSYPLVANSISTQSPSKACPVFIVNITGITHTFLSSNYENLSPTLTSTPVFSLQTGAVLTANNLAVARPSLPTLSLGIAGILSAVPLTTQSVFKGTPALSQYHVLGPSALAVARPTLPSLSLVVTRVLTANALATQATFKGIPSLTQNQVFTANSIATQSVFKGIPALSQVHVIASNVFAVSKPTIPTPSLGIAGVISAAPIQPQSTLLGSPLLSSAYTLTASPIATQAAFKDTPVLIKTINFTANSISAQSTFKGTPLLSSAYTLTPSALAVARSNLPSLSLGIAGVISAIPLMTQSVVIGIPAFSQVHALTSNSISVQRPAITQSIFGRSINFTSNSIAVQSPFIGNPGLGQLGVISCNPLTVQRPSIGTPALSQIYVIISSALAVSRPFLPNPIVTGKGLLSVLPIFTQSPSIGNPKLTQFQKLIPTSIAIARPNIPVVYFVIPGDVILGDSMMDFGLNSLNLADKILFCTKQPTTYAEANTFSIAQKTVSAGSLLRIGPQAGTPNSRKVTVGTIVGAITTGTGIPVSWSIVDSVNSKFIASGPMTGSVMIAPPNKLTLSEFTINIPRNMGRTP
jgi:hypothetical protein